MAGLDYQHAPLPLGHVTPTQLSQLALRARHETEEYSCWSMEVMALAVSILNRKFRHEKRGVARFCNAYVGIMGDSAYSIKHNPIPEDANKVILVGRDPDTKIWICAYFRKKDGEVRGKIYDGVVKRQEVLAVVPEDVTGGVVLTHQETVGPTHDIRMKRLIERLDTVFGSDPWFTAVNGRSPTVPVRDCSITTISTHHQSGPFSLAWGEFMVHGWPVQLTTDPSATGCLPFAWGAVPSSIVHNARGDGEESWMDRWTSIWEYRFECVAKNKAYKYTIDTDDWE